MEDKEIKRKIKNIEAKRLLEKTKLEYSQNILNILNKNPELYKELLNHLEIPEEDFIDKLSGNSKENISFYDEALNYTLKKIKSNKTNKY